MRRSQHLAFDGVALAALPQGGAVATWSEPEGWFAQRLSAAGVAQGAAPSKLGERCRGGVAVAADQRGVELLCLQPAQPSSAPRAVPQGPDEVAAEPLQQAPSNVATAGHQGQLIWRSATPKLACSAPRKLASAGSLSAGVAVSLDDASMWVAYLNADPDAQEVMVVQALRGKDATATASVKQVSRAGHAAGPPSLLARGHGEVPFVAFAEVYLARGQVRADMRLARGQGRAVELMNVRSRDAAPQLARAFGRVHMVYRDRPGAAAPGLFVVTLGASGKPDREPVRLARADGDAASALCECEKNLLTAIPRVYAGDYFIGVNHLDSSLERVAPEQQFYEDRHAFFQVDAACVQGRALLLVAERARPGQAGAILRTVPVSCR